MKIIKNKKDWEALVKMANPNTKIKKYPKEYPCLGLSNRAWNIKDKKYSIIEFKVAYFPKTRSPKKAFIYALSTINNGWQVLFKYLITQD